MMLSYYGELDPLSGIVDEGPESLDAVIRELALLCLLYDAVVVPPENFLAHPLALPAFESLSPFVTAGRLTSSHEPAGPDIPSFIANAAARREDACRKGGRARRDRPSLSRPPGRGRSAGPSPRGVDEVVGRWRALLPERWPILRDVAGQIGGFSDCLERFCRAFPLSDPCREETIRLFEGSRQNGLGAVRWSRYVAHLAALSRRIATPRDFNAL